MTETVKIDNLDFEGKVFVFDKTIAEFKIGGKRYFCSEYDELGGRPYDGHFGEDDPDNTIVKAVLEAGGIVRRSISGKTDYYVVGEYDNKNKDYQTQREKGKPLVAIPLEDLMKALGLDLDEKNTEQTVLEFVEVYDPAEGSWSKYDYEIIVVDDYAVNGDELSDWEYTMEGEPAKLFIRDYVGDKEEITMPTTINGEKVYLPPQFPNTKSFPKCKAKVVNIPGSFKTIPVGLFEYNMYIEQIVLGDGIEEIETNFCFGAANLSKVYFPKTIREVGGWVLKDTAWYESQGSEIIAGGVLLHKYADDDPSDYAATYVVPDGVACIAGYAFYEEESDRNPIYITDVELPGSLRYISNYAFFLLNLSSIKMPSTVVYIGEGAFAGTHLESQYESLLELVDRNECETI